MFKPASLLVVDDLEVNRQLVVEALKDSPLNILQSDNGRAAVSMVEAHRPDLILMDIKMPGLSGYQALELIRGNIGGNVPVIAITAAGMKEDILDIKKAGFDDYLIRPFNKPQLQEKLALFLELEVMSPDASGVLQGKSRAEKDKADDAPWQCPGQVADLLQGHYSRAWQRIRKRQHIPDIKQFAEDIGRLGRKHSLDVLVRYGRDLGGYADAIDVDKLQVCLADFPGVLERLQVVDRQGPPVNDKQQQPGGRSQ